MIAIYTGYPEELGKLRKRIYYYFEKTGDKILSINTHTDTIAEDVLFYKLKKIKPRRRYIIKAEGGFPPYVKILAEAIARISHKIKATVIGYNELFISVCVEKAIDVKVFIYHKGKAYKVGLGDVLDLYPDFMFNIDKYIEKEEESNISEAHPKTGNKNYKQIFKVKKTKTKCCICGKEIEWEFTLKPCECIYLNGGLADVNCPFCKGTGWIDADLGQYEPICDECLKKDYHEYDWWM